MLEAGGQDCAGPIEAVDGREAVATFVYRSRVGDALDPAAVGRLVRAAQALNRSRNLTGMVVFDGGRFLQWIEGPRASVRSLAAAILRDPRHTEIEVLCERDGAARMFAGWDMQLAMRHGRGDGAGISAIRPPEDLLDRMHAFPETAPAGLAEFALAGAACRPDGLGLTGDLRARLRGVLGGVGGGSSPEAGVAGVARRRCGTRIGPDAAVAEQRRETTARALAGLLLAADGDAADRVDALCATAGADHAARAALFERTATLLGDGWLADRCRGFELALALVALDRSVRRPGPAPLPPGAAQAPRFGRARHGGTALVVPLPGEQHPTGSALQAELLGDLGWEVVCPGPTRLDRLEDAVASEGFDVAVVSISPAVRRDEQFGPLALAISRLRRASRNSALSVLVTGRAFADRPDAGRAVGADAACAGVGGLGLVASSARCRLRE